MVWSYSIVIPLEQGLRHCHFNFHNYIGLNSIVIPLEQGLRQITLDVPIVIHTDSVVIPLEQGLRLSVHQNGIPIFFHVD